MSIGVGTFQVTPRMRQYVNMVLDSGRISYGDFSRRFEREFAMLHDSEFAVLSNSGTSSLQVALQALKELRNWRDGDEVIIPAVTFVATANIVLHNRMAPVPVDVESNYYGIDPSLIERAITLRTRAIIPVHAFGQPCNMTAIKQIAEAHHLAIIEDSCECMFVSHADRRVGSWGDVGCFSTYVAHLLSTGVGGIATMSDPVLAARMRSLVNHGRDGIYISADDDDGLSPGQLKEVIARRFNFESIGHSFRITELEAALGLAQLETWQEMITTRQLHAAHLTEKLQPYQEWLQLPTVRPSTDHSWMMYPIVSRHESKVWLCEYLEKHGVETREMLPLLRQPCYQNQWSLADYPVAQWIDRGGFYVGIHQDLQQDDLDYIAATIGKYFAGSKH